MYRPTRFAEDRPDVLIQAVQHFQFAALVTPNNGEIEVSHIPMFVRNGEQNIVLEAHVAKQNKHWKIADGTQQSVAIFQGPHAYISPSFYPSKQETGKVVPTWSYITVHAYGTLKSIQDPEWLLKHVNKLTDRNEGEREMPWRVDDAPSSYVEALTRGIVGLEFTVERLEGTWKLNQHKSDADREGTRRGLAASGDAGLQLSRAMEGLDL